jgi:hypothetical protein
MGLSREELLEHIGEQVGFLTASAASYDAGLRAEAKRMAVAIRVLVHETQTSHSLLGQIGELESLRFATIGDEIEPEATISTGALTRFTHDGVRPVLVPNLDAPTRWLPFEEWWTEPVYVVNRGSFNRRQYVLDLANRGGGAHVDSRAGNSYRKFAFENAIGWMSSQGDGPITVDRELNNPLPASVRTIAHEVLLTLDGLGEVPN